MNTLLIADDEHLIREGLCTLIDWHAFGFRIAGIAKDGYDTLDQCRALQPDLVIMDIQMPGCDGLQVIETLRAQGSRSRFLILSGFAEFEYARRALSSHVEGYLLKPVDETELTGHILRLRKVLEDGTADSAIDSSELPANPGSMYAFGGIPGMLSGGSPANPFPPGIFAERFAPGLFKDWNHFQVLLIRPEHGPDQASMHRLADALTEAMVDQGYFIPMSDRFCIVLKQAYVKAYSLRQLYAVIDSVMAPIWAEFTASIGGLVYAVAEIRESWSKAESLLNLSFFAEPGTVISDSIHADAMHADLNRGAAGTQGGPAWLQVDGDTDSLDGFTERLNYALDIRSSESVDILIRQLSETCLRRGLSERRVKTETAHIFGSVIDLFVRRHQLPESVRREASDRIMDLYGLSRFAYIQSHMKRGFDEIIKHLGAGDAAGLVQRMTDLIERNYGENLKLELLADVFHYNSAYLGKLFKTHTGEYFNTYLDKVRVRRAKDLLEQGLKVYKVAEMVGYSYVDYFHAKFKKYAGMAPTVYRARFHDQSDRISADAADRLG